MYWNKILEKIPYPTYDYPQSRTSIRRKKNNIGNVKKKYFGIGLSFNIDGNRVNEKQIYKEQVEKIKSSLNKDELDFIYKWIEKNYKKISKNISIKDVNSKGKLFMHILWILPYVKQNFKGGNIEGFIARILYNSTRSWYTNWCKNHFNKISQIKE